MTQHCYFDCRQQSTLGCIKLPNLFLCLFGIADDLCFFKYLVEANCSCLVIIAHSHILWGTEFLHGAGEVDYLCLEIFLWTNTYMHACTITHSFNVIRKLLKCLLQFWKQASPYKPLNKNANTSNNDCIWSLSPWVLEALWRYRVVKKKGGEMNKDKRSQDVQKQHG